MAGVLFSAQRPPISLAFIPVANSISRNARGGAEARRGVAPGSLNSRSLPFLQSKTSGIPSLVTLRSAKPLREELSTDLGDFASETEIRCGSNALAGSGIADAEGANDPVQTNSIVNLESAPALSALQGTEQGNAASGEMEPATRFDPSSNELLPRGRFRGVVVAGTFDRFHDGHRTLLRAAVAMVAATPDKGGEDTITSSSGGGGSSSCIVVGIADGPLLSKKYLSEMIQPYNERKEVAEKFLQQELQRQGKAPGLVRLDFAPIQDPVPERGGSDPSLDCIVVSEETVGGAAAINRMRAANQIIPLHVVVASTVPAPSTAALPLAPATTSTAADISKLSSSLLREQCLGTFLPLPSKQKRQRRQHKGRLQAGPYLVGLTGGIASGKSTVARLLCSLASSSSSSSAPTAAAASPSAAATVSAAVPIEPEGTREAAREGWHSEEREAGQGRHSEEGGAGQGRQWRVGAVDCDRLAHRAYEPGTPAYRRIVELFGASVVRAADGQIDRAALGAQVFSCPEKMAALTGVVWPMVRQIVEEEREAAGAGGWEVTFESPKKATNCEKAPTSSEFTGGASTFSECTEKASASETCRNSFTIRPIAPPAAVLIVEAAMMVEAGSDQTVDEVWVVFVPEAEAKARLMARNGVTEEEAGKRIAAQMTSSARLAHADVAIYNGASEDVTRHQLERAWSEVATQRAGPCLEQWNENFNRLQEQWSISSGNPHSMAAHMQPHFLEAARSVWTRWAALMWRLDVDADVAERWFLKLVLVEEGVRGEKEGEKAGEEGGQQVGVAGGWVAAVIVCFQHLRSQIHRVDRPNALKLALFFALHAASLSAPTPPLPPSTTQPPTTDDPPSAFPSFTPELFNAAGVLAAAREALQRFAVDADHSQECLDQTLDLFKPRCDGAEDGSTDRNVFWDVIVKGCIISAHK